MMTRIDDRVLETEHLLLRRSAPEDAEAIAVYRNDPEVRRHQGWDRTDPDSIRAEIVRMAARTPGDPGWVQFSVFVRDTGDLVGDVGLSPSDSGGDRVIKIGYTIDPAHQGRGYGTEAAAALMAFAFEAVGAEIVRAYASADNAASRRVAERIGMTLMETFTEPDGDDVWHGVRYERHRPDGGDAG